MKPISKRPLVAAISLCVGSTLPLYGQALTITNDGSDVPENTDLEIRAQNIQVTLGESTSQAQANSRFDVAEGSMIRGQLAVEIGRNNPSLGAQTCQVNFDIVAREDLDSDSDSSGISGADATVLDSNKSITVTIDDNGELSSSTTDFEVEIVGDFEEEASEHYGIYADNMTTTCSAQGGESSASVSGYYYAEFGYLGGAILYSNVDNVTREAPEPPVEEPISEEPIEEPLTDDPELTYKTRQATARVKAQVESSTNLSFHNARVRNKNLAREIAKRRSTGGGFSTSGLTADIKGQRLSLAPLGGSAGDQASPWGGFINGSIEVGEDAQFDISSDLLIAGVDYKTQHWILGAAYTYANGSSEQEHQAAADLTQKGFSVFASYFNQGLYTNLILSQSINDYALSRTQNNGFAVGQTEGDEFSYALSAGYQGNRGQWNYRTFVIFDAAQLDVDGYSEAGADLNFTVDKIDREIQNLELGIHLSYTMNMSFGVLNPLAEISYRGNTGEKQWATSTHYTAEDGTTGAQALNYAIGDDTYLSGQLGLSAVFPHGWSAFVSYQQDFSRDDWDVKQYDLGLRWEF